MWRSVAIKAWKRSSTGGGVFPTGFQRAGAVLALLTLALPAPSHKLIAGTSAWTINLSAAVKETFDSNVYLQSETSRANRESLVTSFLPQLTARWSATPAFVARLAYQPEATWFHSETSENFVLHRALVSLSGRGAETSYESTASVVLIDGDSAGLIWTGPGGAPATGGPTVRDRRDATVYRASFGVTQDFGAWFVRPGATFYLHDFQTDHRDPATGYQSYVDRGEVNGGLDAGRRIESIAVWAGYRYGVQNQARLLQFPEQYDNTFHRVRLGAEGAPVAWLKFNFALGPEFRRYGTKVPAGFGARDEINFFVDSCLTITPTKSDTITMSAKRFEQPGSSGRGVYEDSTYDLCWRHQFNDGWTLGVSGRAYGTAFLRPAQRDDWILSQSAFLNWNITRQLNAEISYTHESGETTTPNASAREYDRHLVAFGVRYNFEARPAPAPRS